MRRLAPALIFITAAFLCGCAESHLTGSLLYMTPYKFEQLDCTELKARAAAAALRTKDVEQLRDKASASAAGPVINSLVYGPDYNRARWDQRLYEDEIARKNCDAPPPPPPPAEAAK